MSMFSPFLRSRVNPPAFNLLAQCRRSWLCHIAVGTASCMLVGLGSFNHEAIAADPFRATNPRSIGDRTEKVFRLVFEQGNYAEASRKLNQAEADEPMAYGLRASLAYTQEDWDALRTHAIRTQQTAEALIATDALRGNIYLATGHFLEGAYILKTKGLLNGTTDALSKLQLVFDHLDKAAAISPKDPELNMIRGFMDLMIAVNLPFANPEDAIQRLETHAGPRYLALRGIALGYRDLKQPQQALEYVDQSLRFTPNNPELHYLKAQILRAMKTQKSHIEAREYFEKALSKSDILPKSSVKQIFYEYCRNEEQVTPKQRNCGALRESIPNNPKNPAWGPEPKNLPIVVE